MADEQYPQKSREAYSAALRAKKSSQALFDSAREILAIIEELKNPLGNIENKSEIDNEEAQKLIIPGSGCH